MGYMIFQVRQYEAPPHCIVTSVSALVMLQQDVRNKRCGKCGGNHNFTQCQAEVLLELWRETDVWCEHHVRAVEGETITADALKIVLERIRRTNQVSGQWCIVFTANILDNKNTITPGRCSMGS